MSGLACASHFLIDMPLFGAPVVFLIGAVLLIRRSERRREPDPHPEPLIPTSLRGREGGISAV